MKLNISWNRSRNASESQKIVQEGRLCLTLINSPSVFSTTDLEQSCSINYYKESHLVAANKTSLSFAIFCSDSTLKTCHSKEKYITLTKQVKRWTKGDWHLKHIWYMEKRKVPSFPISLSTSSSRSFFFFFYWNFCHENSGLELSHWPIVWFETVK